MCVVIDLDVVCLICLQPNKDMTAIFTADGDDPELQIAQKISILSELKTNQNNRALPSKICKNCLQDLKAAWRFRKNCQAAVTIFQTIVKLDVKSENLAAPNELDGEKIKVPHGLQIKKVSIGNEGEDGKKTPNYEKESKDDKSINDKVNSSLLYEDLVENNYNESQDKESHDFQITEDSNENDDQQKELDNDEEFVEYYITEECAIDEQIIDGQKIYPKENLVRIVKKQDSEDEEQLNDNYHLTRRGRSKKQNLSEKEEKTKVVRTRTKVIENPHSSEDTMQPEIREVKTRKRKSHSPETKTPKICEICGNSYRYQHALNAHMRRHFNDKPFPCECCDKAFVSNVELRRHMRVHTGQKPYACQYCERRFSDFGSRIKHERTHTGERPYHCSTCGKSFAYPHVLSVHIRTHTGEKRFRCDYCSKGFTKKAYLLSHVNQHHSNFEQEIDETVEDKDENNLKSTTNLEVCVYTTELSNEIIDEEYVEENFEEPVNVIMSGSTAEPKMEAADEEMIHEIEENEPDEFTITVR